MTKANSCTDRNKAIALLREYMKGTPSFADWQRRVQELLDGQTVSEIAPANAATQDAVEAHPPCTGASAPAVAAPSAGTPRTFHVCEDHKSADWNQPHLEDESCVLCRLFYLEAQESLLEEWQQRAQRAEDTISEIERPLDAQMARLNGTVARLNEENLSLKFKLFASKPGMWREWKDADFHDLSTLCGQLERELADAKQALSETGEAWRPMVSAPLDGTEIEILFRHFDYWTSLKLDGKEKADEQWQAAQRAHWIDHNGGGWTWHGMAGTPVGWRPLDAIDSSANSKEPK